MVNFDDYGIELDGETYIVAHSRRKEPCQMVDILKYGQSIYKPMFCINYKTPQNQIEHVIRIYLNAYKEGYSAGKNMIQSEVKKALDIH